MKAKHFIRHYILHWNTKRTEFCSDKTMHRDAWMNTNLVLYNGSNLKLDRYLSQEHHTNGACNFSLEMLIICYIQADVLKQYINWTENIHQYTNHLELGGSLREEVKPSMGNNEGIRAIQDSGLDSRACQRFLKIFISTALIFMKNELFLLHY